MNTEAILQAEAIQKYYSFRAKHGVRRTKRILTSYLKRPDMPMIRDTEPEELEHLLDFLRNPRPFIAESGRETGICLMCGRELTDPASIAEGIGPVCAGKL